MLWLSAPAERPTGGYSDTGLRSRLTGGIGDNPQGSFQIVVQPRFGSAPAGASTGNTIRNRMGVMSVVTSVMITIREKMSS